jgi:hypothetical protein
MAVHAKRKVTTMEVVSNTEQKKLILTMDDLYTIAGRHRIDPKDGWSLVTAGTDFIRLPIPDERQYPDGRGWGNIRHVVFTFRRDVTDQPASTELESKK